MRFAVFAAALLAVTSLPAASPAQNGVKLSPTEQRMRAYIADHKADELALLQRAVDIKSQTLDLAGVRAVGKLFAASLDSLGFTTSWVPMPESMNRAGHLVATRKGTRGKRLLLIGHLDTVLEGDSLNWAIVDSTHAKGAGSNDMKGGDVAIIYALKAMQSVGALNGTTITVVMTGDEEDAGTPLSGARGALIDAARNSDAALAFEGGNRSDATIARRGSSKWQLTVTGRGAHSSGMFGRGVGYGAVFEAARVLNEFRAQLAGQPNLTFSPSVIVGGTDVSFDTTRDAGSASSKYNIVASKVIVSGDLRFLTESQKDSVRARMRDITTHDNLAGTSAAIEFEDEYPGMAPTPGNYALLAVYDSSSQALGYGPVTALDPSRRGAGDLSFVAPFVSGLDGLGVGGPGAHTPAERIDLTTLPMQTERAALLFYRLTR